MNRPLNPFSCRWCGLDQRGHGRRWTPPSKGGPGWHPWEQPTERQIKQRMLRRRADRLAAEPSKYHATTAWEADSTGEEGIPYCADCGTDACGPWTRIQDKLDRIRWRLPKRKRRASGGWGADLPF
ncbi:hypothetical protein [Streptomyces asiaticus]|uniref:hypothetical protein n=1 Tax=Streptomyces asiaticus TaxID=114695 RepID=UPI00381A8C58